MQTANERTECNKAGGWRLLRCMRKFAVVAVCVLVLVSCGADRHLKRGDKYWAIGEFYEASLEYAKAYSKTPSKQSEAKAAVAYKVGESNRRLGYSAKALAGYRNAARYGLTDTLTYFYLGEMQRMGRDYKAAAESYQLYLDIFPGDTLAMIGLDAANHAAEEREKGSEYTVHEYKLFNATYADYSPCLTPDDQIIFSSTRRDATGDEASGITGMKSGDLFYARKNEKGEWQRPEAVDEGVNTEYDEGTPSVTPDGQRLFFTRCAWDAQYPRLAQIFESQRSDAKWGTPQLVSLTADTLSNFAHPAVSPDGRYLYFVSDMPGGLGGLDIWRAEMGEHGFGAVENLGSPINTAANEMFPTFRPNGDLYYSSNGKGGFGGLDIYRARLDSTASRWTVEHLPYPMNSNGDDFGMTFEGVYNRGFFSSNRSNRRGWDKIYSFEHPEIVRSMTGWVYEQDGYELTDAVVYMVGDDGTQKKIGMRLDGSFTEGIKPGVHYIFLATCQGYMNYRNELYIPEGTGSVDTTLQFPLPSLNIPVLVRNVFYAFDRAEILPQSIPALEGLTDLLKTNSSIAIELSSHCDYRGSDEYNIKLSQRRAEAVVNYLTTHGISKDRVVARGYGKSRPKTITPKFAERYPFLKAGDVLTEEFISKLTPEQQDSCNALNRRTEFSVLKTTFGILDDKGNVISPTLQAKADTAAVDSSAHSTMADSTAVKQAPTPPNAGENAPTRGKATDKKDSKTVGEATRRDSTATRSRVRNQRTRIKPTNEEGGAL